MDREDFFDPRGDLVRHEKSRRPHRLQVALAREAFIPGEAEIERARALLAAYDEQLVGFGSELHRHRQQGLADVAPLATEYRYRADGSFAAAVERRWGFGGAACV